MNIQVMSRRDAEFFSTQDHDYTSAVISISNSYDMNANIKKTDENNIKDILFLNFEDIQKTNDTQYWKKDEGLTLYQYKDNTGFVYEERIFQLFTAEHARKICDFLEKWLEKVDTLIIHCNAGISRSAGVAAAISKYTLGKDDYYFYTGKYHPNMTVYDVLLEYLVTNGKLGNSKIIEVKKYD